MGHSQGQAIAVTTGQQLILITLSALPNWAYGVNDPSGRQIISLGNFWPPPVGQATPAFDILLVVQAQLPDGLRPSTPPPPRRDLIGCIDYRIYVLAGNVPPGLPEFAVFQSCCLLSLIHPIQ